MLLYYITDRNAFSGTEAEKRVRLLAKIAEAARCGVDFIQLREKDLSPRELERLAREAVQVVRDHTSIDSLGVQHLPGVGRCGPTRLLINSRTDVALAVGADGVHLTSSDIAASDARAIQGTFSAENRELGTDNFLVCVSCHTAEEVRSAQVRGADFAVFAPVFEKKVRDAERVQNVPATAGAAALQSPQHDRDITLFARTRDEGLAALKAACQSTSSLPVLALGGITLENTPDCVNAGAAGIAAIRLFQENDIAELVRRLG